MSYVLGCKTDVFLSYGHIDNKDGWVKAFHAKLEERLSVVLGDAISVWRDEKRMDGLDPIWPTIEEWVTSCAMFVTILSPRYVQSNSCLREIQAFSAAASCRASQVPFVSRIVRIIKFPYDAVLAPDNLRQGDTVGYQFFEPREDETYREYQPATDKFSEEVDRVAQAMANRLKLLRQEQVQTRPVLAQAAAMRRRIFIADVTSDRKLDRDTLTKELGRHHDVLSMPMGLETGPTISAEAAKLVAQATYSIHILGSCYGIVPEGTEQSMVELQYRAGMDHRSNSPFRQIVFVPEKLDITEPRQKVFTDLILRQAPEVWTEHTELIRGGQKDLLEAVRDMIDRDAQGMWRPLKSKSVYVMCTKPDVKEQALKTIRTYLFDRGYANDTPAFEAGDLDLAEVEKQLILGSGGTLIYYGSAPDAWVKMKRRLLIKILGEGQSVTQHIRALYLDSPPSESKQADYIDLGMRTLPEGGVPPLLLLGDCGPFSPEKLQPFLDLV